MRIPKTGPRAYETAEAKLEILTLREKMDEMREKNWAELITMQQEQIRLLTPVMKERAAVSR